MHYAIKRVLADNHVVIKAPAASHTTSAIHVDLGTAVAITFVLPCSKPRYIDTRHIMNV